MLPKIKRQRKYAVIAKQVKGGKPSDKPNIVIVITDDQGYGDLGMHRKSVIKTPHTDKLANESVWLTDYHVAPTCSPTRALYVWSLDKPYRGMAYNYGSFHAAGE